MRISSLRFVPLFLLVFAGACDRLFCDNTAAEIVYFEPGPDSDPAFDVTAGTTKQLTAAATRDPDKTSCQTFLYDSANRPDLFQFSSTNTAIATVSVTGLVSGLAPGQVTIRVTSAGIQSSNDVVITVK